MKWIEKAKATLKSSETDDWLDVKVVRPLAYLCALGFAKLGIHPNSVTILSMVIGASSCVFFASGSYFYDGIEGLIVNVVAIILLLWADVYDCADGQLARMTGKTSRLGRILDGAAGFVWFVPIYLAFVYRFYYNHSIEFGWLGINDTPENTLIATAVVFVLSLLSGFYGISGQQRVADYYIQAHLFFLKGEKGSELDTSARQQQILDEMPADEKLVYKLFQKNYVGYTLAQEKKTPQFQALMAKLRERYGSSDNIPSDFRRKFHDFSLPVIKLNGLLTFNFRTFWLIIFCLLDVPALYFVFEVVAMSLLCEYIVHRHETFCKRLADEL